jgi:hypothetical protein
VDYFIIHFFSWICSHVGTKYFMYVVWGVIAWKLHWLIKMRWSEFYAFSIMDKIWCSVSRLYFIHVKKNLHIYFEIYIGVCRTNTTLDCALVSEFYALIHF